MMTNKHLQSFVGSFVAFENLVINNDSRSIGETLSHFLGKKDSTFSYKEDWNG